ncbi:uncharacterized protein LOC135821062 isoform X2 [Sycon ciliatum]|uniref:uncharacterized protein LOC135821062 isoform X2 n=1 Tax=Sycon ciliatum TaxID=27933 RepID=UPI0031F66CD8
MNVSPEQLGFRLLSKLVGARILASTLLLAVCLLLARPTCANPTPNANNQSRTTHCARLTVLHGTIRYSGGSLAIGSTALVTCEEGWTASGNSTAVVMCMRGAAAGEPSALATWNRTVECFGPSNGIMSATLVALAFSMVTLLVLALFVFVRRSQLLQSMQDASHSTSCYRFCKMWNKKSCGKQLQPNAKSLATPDASRSASTMGMVDSRNSVLTDNSGGAGANGGHRFSMVTLGSHTLSNHELLHHDDGGGKMAAALSRQHSAVSSAHTSPSSSLVPQPMLCTTSLQSATLLGMFESISPMLAEDCQAELEQETEAPPHECEQPPPRAPCDAPVHNTHTDNKDKERGRQACGASVSAMLVRPPADIDFRTPASSPSRASPRSHPQPPGFYVSFDGSPISCNFRSEQRLDKSARYYGSEPSDLGRSKWSLAVEREEFFSSSDDSYMSAWMPTNVHASPTQKHFLPSHKYLCRVNSDTSNDAGVSSESLFSVQQKTDLPTSYSQAALKRASLSPGPSRRLPPPHHRHHPVSSLYSNRCRARSCFSADSLQSDGPLPSSPSIIPRDDRRRSTLCSYGSTSGDNLSMGGGKRVLLNRALMHCKSSAVTSSGSEHSDLEDLHSSSALAASHSKKSMHPELQAQELIRDLPQRIAIKRKVILPVKSTNSLPMSASLAGSTHTLSHCGSAGSPLATPERTRRMWRGVHRRDVASRTSSTQSAASLNSIGVSSSTSRTCPSTWRSEPKLTQTKSQSSSPLLLTPPSAGAGGKHSTPASSSSAAAAPGTVLYRIAAGSSPSLQGASIAMRLPFSDSDRPVMMQARKSCCTSSLSLPLANTHSEAASYGRLFSSQDLYYHDGTANSRRQAGHTLANASCFALGTGSNGLGGRRSSAIQPLFEMDDTIGQLSPPGQETSQLSSRDDDALLTRVVPAQSDGNFDAMRKRYSCTSLPSILESY